MNKNTPLDIYDDMPPAMKKYIANYGWHFNKLAYEYAVSKMYNTDENSHITKPILGYTKDEVETLLRNYSVKLKNKIMYDFVYVATMCKADYLGVNKAIEDEKHLAYFIKNTIDDDDASSETTFRRWVATMIGNGQPIDWTEIC